MHIIVRRKSEHPASEPRTTAFSACMRVTYIYSCVLANMRCVTYICALLFVQICTNAYLPTCIRRNRILCVLQHVYSQLIYWLSINIHIIVRTKSKLHASNPRTTASSCMRVCYFHISCVTCIYVLYKYTLRSIVNMYTLPTSMLVYSGFISGRFDS